MPGRQKGTVPAACWGTGMSWEGRGQSKRGSAPACICKPNQGLPVPCRPLPVGLHWPQSLSLSPCHVWLHRGHGEGKRSHGGGTGQGLQE